ncbi:ASST-domain-containing protein [Aspergillus stella-maris]|uniref:ASST-domain-containing protein n=1 Tax=Aspergillus stella-maris TaxID=1810926 RepID=UPI003CCDAF1C
MRMLRCLLGGLCFWGSLALAESVIRGSYVSTNYDLYNDGEFGHRPNLQFESSREFAPLAQVNVWKPDLISLTGSHIFLRHDGDDLSNDGHELSIRALSSPLILDASDLSPVYMNRSFANVFGTRVQEDRGKRYLTFWAGDKGNGIGDGYGLAYDDTYQLVYKVSTQNIDVHADLHEFAFTGNGSALVTGVNTMRVNGKDLSTTYGWDNVMPGTMELDILEGVFQEIDLDTNEVLFDWRALDHVNPLDSFEPMGSGWDIYHINSIEKTQAGNYLISIRHTHSIHLIDGKTGAIIWTLGGARNRFRELPPAITNTTTSNSSSVQPLLTMSWQHHARFVPGTNETEITFFDNHAKVTTHGECRNNCSRGLHIAIDTTSTPPTAQILRQFTHPVHLQSQSQGSVQPLGLGNATSNPELDLDSDLNTDTEYNLGNIFIGWGRCPSFTEHTPSGETVLDVQFSPWHSADIPDALDNYRAYKMDWNATPWWDPVFTLAEAEDRDGDSVLVVYISWNGATGVRRWVVRGSASAPNMSREEDDGESGGDDGEILAVSPKMGFETRLAIPYGEEYTDMRYLWVEALDGHGNVLRASEVLDSNTATISQDSSSSSSALETFSEMGLESTAAFPQLLPVPVDGYANSSTITGDDDDDDSEAMKLIWLASSLGGLTLTLAAVFGTVYFVRWRGRNGYNSLELEASDFDLRPIDIDEVDEYADIETASLELDPSKEGRGDEGEEGIGLLSKPGG